MLTLSATCNARSHRGAGFKTNYFDMHTRQKYWISECRKDGMDALYSTDVTVDADALEEYWVNIRNLPDKVGTREFRARGKY